PSWSTVEPYSGRGTTARFTSTAIRRGPRPSAPTRSATVAPAANVRGSSFRTICTTPCALAETIASHRRADNCGSRLDSGVPVLIFLGLLVQSRIDSNGRPTVAEVSLSALRHNCRRARELCGPDVAVMAVVMADVSSFAALVRGLGELGVEGVFSHFASADAVETAAARAQTGRFVGAVETLVAAGLRPPEVHLANSAAVLAAPEARFTMVRPGIMLYGYAPAPHLAPRAAVRPAMRLRTRVAQVRRVPPGTPVGYAGTFVTTRPSTIATLPVGYADGYHRLASNRARVAVRGQRVPVAGRVCMDHTMLDVTDLPGVRTGDPAVLFGGTIGADELAAWCDTIAYEILTSVARRVPRVYVEEFGEEFPEACQER